VIYYLEKKKISGMKEKSRAHSRDRNLLEIEEEGSRGDQSSNEPARPRAYFLSKRVVNEKSRNETKGIPNEGGENLFVRQNRAGRSSQANSF